MSTSKAKAQSRPHPLLGPWPPVFADKILPSIALAVLSQPLRMVAMAERSTSQPPSWFSPLTSLPAVCYSSEPSLHSPTLSPLPPLAQTTVI